MTDILEKFNQLKQTVEDARQNADRAAGALEQITKTLQKDFDCKTINIANKKLKQLQKQEITAKEDFEKAMKEYEKKWKERL